MFAQLTNQLAQVSALENQRLPPVKDLITDWRAYAAAFVLLVMLLTASGGRKPMGFHPADKNKKNRHMPKMHHCPRCGGDLLQAPDDKPNSAFDKDPTIYMTCARCNWHS